MSPSSRRRRHAGGAPGTRDPYRGDPNIRGAAGLQVVGMTALGAGTGFGMAGWFQFQTALGAGVGAAVGFVLGNLFLTWYGGRQTR